MGVFRVDGPIYRFLSRFVDVLVLNFWLLVCSIPIVTVGASITAAFSVTMKMVNAIFAAMKIHAHILQSGANIIMMMMIVL